MKISDLVESFFERYRDMRIAKGDVNAQYAMERPQKRNLLYVKIIDNAAQYHGCALERHGRWMPFRELIETLLVTYGLPNTEFLVNLADGDNPDFPMFGVIRLNTPGGPRGLIPFPMGNTRGSQAGLATPVIGWDAYCAKYITEPARNYPWESKIPKAFWRGTFKMITWSAGKWGIERAQSWRDMSRGKLYLATRMHPDLFDVGFSRIVDKFHSPLTPITDDFYGTVETVLPISACEQAAYKYIIEAGNVFDWSEATRRRLHMNSTLMFCPHNVEEYFYPLLKPHVHYLPVAPDFANIVEVVTSAVRNDSTVRTISANANRLCAKYLTEGAMIEYAIQAIKRYTTLLAYQVT